MRTQATVVDPLIDRLCEAVLLKDVDAIVRRIKHDLESFIPSKGLRFPERFRRVKPESYARRLLYRDPDLGFTAVVMTWGPGQHTALHDHAGIWCVEGVVEGVMEVSRFELLDEPEAGVCRFAKKGSVLATAGSAGALIPPFEHHMLANPQLDRVSLTLHVYGGEMDHCSIFEPAGDGFYRRRSKILSYDE